MDSTDAAKNGQATEGTGRHRPAEPDGHLGVTEPIALNLIDEEPASLMRVARRPDVIAELKARFEAGEDVDPPSMRRLPNGRFAPINGLHRVRAAADAGLSTLVCKVLDCTEEHALELAIQADIKSGTRPTAADIRLRIEQATLRFADKSERAIAALVNTSRARVQAVQTRLEAEGRWKRRDKVAGRDGRKYPAKPPRTSTALSSATSTSQESPSLTEVPAPGVDVQPTQVTQPADPEPRSDQTTENRAPQSDDHGVSGESADVAETRRSKMWSLLQELLRMLDEDASSAPSGDLERAFDTLHRAQRLLAPLVGVPLCNACDGTADCTACDSTGVGDPIFRVETTVAWEISPTTKEATR